MGTHISALLETSQWTNLIKVVVLVWLESEISGISRVVHVKKVDILLLMMCICRTDEKLGVLACSILLI